MTSKTCLRLYIGVCLVIGVGCNRRIETAADALHDADPQVRREAIRSLAASPDDVRAQLPALVAVLHDEDPAVRVAAALEIQKAAPDNSECRSVLEQALRAGQGPVFLELGRSGPSAGWAAPTLAATLADRRAPIRALAAQTLGEIGVSDDQIESALRRGLHDENAAVRKACQRAVERLSKRSLPNPP